eukprot:SAG31_NODE_1035_length_10225_cov_2.372506_4_plen_165_part_00
MIIGIVAGVAVLVVGVAVFCRRSSNADAEKIHRKTQQSRGGGGGCPAPPASPAPVRPCSRSGAGHSGSSHSCRSGGCRATRTNGTLNYSSSTHDDNSGRSWPTTYGHGHSSGTISVKSRRFHHHMCINPLKVEFGIFHLARPRALAAHRHTCTRPPRTALVLWF